MKKGTFDENAPFFNVSIQKSKVNICTVSVTVDYIVSTEISVFSLEVNINRLNVLASAILVSCLAGFLDFLHRIVFWIGHNYIDSKVRSDAKISVIFDQSPLIDENAERLRDLQEVKDGLMAAYEYRAKWYGETEETAKAMIKEISDSEGSYSDNELMSFGDGG